MMGQSRYPKLSQTGRLLAIISLCLLPVAVAAATVVYSPIQSGHGVAHAQPIEQETQIPESFSAELRILEGLAQSSLDDSNVVMQAEIARALNRIADQMYIDNCVGSSFGRRGNDWDNCHIHLGKVPRTD